jgi:hypothetical protein
MPSSSDTSFCYRPYNLSHRTVLVISGSIALAFLAIIETGVDRKVHASGANGIQIYRKATELEADESGRCDRRRLSGNARSFPIWHDPKSGFDSIVHLEFIEDIGEMKEPGELRLRDVAVENLRHGNLRLEIHRRRQVQNPFIGKAKTHRFK